MDYIEKESLSKAEAVFAACLALGIDEKDAQVQVLSAPGARRIKVRVGKPGVAMPASASQGPSQDAAPAAPAPASAPAPAPAPVQESYARPAEAAPRNPSLKKQPSPAQAEALRGDVEKLLELMGTPSKVELKEHAGNTVINVTGEKEGLLIGKRGMTLEALQTVAEQMLHAASGDHALYAVVDIADYRFRQERKLMDQARELAGRALESGEQQTMGPLNPAERRVVHLELKSMEGVESFSVGSGSTKKVVIQKKA